MELVQPRLVVLDSSTLGKVAKDYWSDNEAARLKARDFLDGLQQRSLYVAVMWTHISELVRHSNSAVVKERENFLRRIPLIAWVRPTDGHWFPGSVVNVIGRELRAVITSTTSDWSEIIDTVREDLWETGTGAEIISEDERFWSLIEAEARRQHESEMYVASIARTNPGGISHLTIAEARRLQRRPVEDFDGYFHEFKDDMKGQLHLNGDKRLKSEDAAHHFAYDIRGKVNSFMADGRDPFDLILEHFNVPAEFVDEETMTIADVAKIGVYMSQLKTFGEALSPPRRLTLKDVPPDTLPSYVLEHRLADIQRKAVRVSGSDFGDGHISTLLLYTDGLEVDKRTFEYLSQIKRADCKLGGLMAQFFKSSDYAQIPVLFD